MRASLLKQDIAGHYIFASCLLSTESLTRSVLGSVGATLGLVGGVPPSCHWMGDAQAGQRGLEGHKSCDRRCPEEPRGVGEMLQCHDTCR